VSAFGLKVGRRFGSSGVELLGGPAPVYLLVKVSGTGAASTTKQVRNYARHWTPVHLDFVVKDIEAAVKKTVSVGATLETPITTHKWGRLALMADPFGNGYCFVEFLGGAMTKSPSSSNSCRPTNRCSGTPLIGTVIGKLQGSVVLKALILGLILLFQFGIAQGKENEIYSFKVLKQTQDSVLFEISYYYSGDHGDKAKVTAWPKPAGFWGSSIIPLVTGNGVSQLNVKLMPKAPKEVVSNSIEFFFYSDGGPPFCRKEFIFQKKWVNSAEPATSPKEFQR